MKTLNNLDKIKKTVNNLLVLTVVSHSLKIKKSR
jgi:hypothetical protein